MTKVVFILLMFILLALHVLLGTAPPPTLFILSMRQSWVSHQMRAFNKQLSGVRIMVEHAFGRLKGCF